MTTRIFKSLVRSTVTACLVGSVLLGGVWVRQADAAGLALTTNAVDSLGNHFSYQGMLTDNGAPAAGLHDFRFQVLNEAMVVFAQFEAADVNVADGLFTTTVTVGNGIFNGERRFLKVAARKDGESDYVEIGAATEIQATPYALFAKKAASATFAEEATFASALKNAGETIVQVSAFDMIESDGGNTLAFAARATGRLEVTRPAGPGTAYVYVPVDIPAEIVGMNQKLTTLSFCYSGKADDGIGILAGIQEAGVRQVNKFDGSFLLQEAFNPELRATDACVNVATGAPQVIGGSLWVRFKVTASPVPLEFGEIKLTFVNEFVTE